MFTFPNAGMLPNSIPPTGPNKTLYWAGLLPKPPTRLRATTMPLQVMHCIV